MHVPSIIIKIYMYIILSNPSHCGTDMNIAINISFISCIDVACHLVSILESFVKLHHPLEKYFCNIFNLRKVAT